MSEEREYSIQTDEKGRPMTYWGGMEPYKEPVNGNDPVDLSDSSSSKLAFQTGDILPEECQRHWRVEEA